jgi:hypothetical protein
MRAELIPVLFGILVAVVGALLVVDARLPDAVRPLTRERRRRVRTERHRGGESLIGLGTVCMGAALIGRDVWRYGAIAVILGAILVAAGAFLNRHYLLELFAFRGPARRAGEGEPPSESPAETPERRARIR